MGQAQQHVQFVVQDVRDAHATRFTPIGCEPDRLVKSDGADGLESSGILRCEAAYLHSDG